MYNCTNEEHLTPPDKIKMNALTKYLSSTVSSATSSRGIGISQSRALVSASNSVPPISRAALERKKKISMYNVEVIKH